MDIKMVDRMRLVNIADIRPYENNARLNDNAVPALCESIRRFGFVVPVVLSSDMSLICGHTRVKAASRLGMAQVPAVFAEGLTGAEIKALRLADNKVAEIAMWDMEKLAAELDSIGSEIDMSDFGFEIGQNEEQEGNEEEEECEGEGNGERPEPKSRRGEVYALGEHRLMCGDSTSEEDWETLMAGEKADMCFTDPPYGVAIGNKNKELNSKPSPTGGNRSRRRIETNIENDVIGAEELKQLLVPAMSNIRRACKDDASYYVTSPQGGELFEMMLSVMSEAGLPVRHVLIWVKNQPTFSMCRLDYDYKHEPIFYTWTKSHHNYRNGKFRTSVWEFDKPKSSRLHPTMKPVELVMNAILDGTEEGMVVVDGFGGSGTTLIAAEETQRKARLMEIDPHYCDVIRQRYAESVGMGDNWLEATPAI